MAVIVRLRDTGLLFDLKWHAEADLHFTEPMRAEEWSGTKTDLGVIILPYSKEDNEPCVSFVCLASKGRRWTTRFARASFSHLAAVNPLPLTEWVNIVPSQFHAPLNFAIESTGRPIPPGTWTHARAALVTARPELEATLRNLEGLLRGEVELDEREQELLVDEKDALGLSLSIANIERGPIATWTKPTGPAAPFLTGLTPGRVREDVMVIHDASRVPGWVKVVEPMLGATQFSDRFGHSLTVMNVNRHKIEEITGVDLLYFRHEPASFALLQYKRFMPRSGSSGPATDFSLAFRPDLDANFAKELSRMRAVEERAVPKRSLKAAPPGQDALPLLDPAATYRLHAKACWIKLCKPEPFQPLESDLVPGMYLPLDYYEQLVESPMTLGPRGGRVITYDNVGRWISNTLFINLMSGGWIGSSAVQTAWLTETISAAIEAKRSVMVAEETTVGPRRRRR